MKNDTNEVWVDMPSDPNQNPCLNCGACCNHFRVSFYQGELKSAGGYVPDDLVSTINSFMVAMTGTECGKGKCVALTGEVGKSISCSIYENRPSVCRVYDLWEKDGSPNPDCQRLRKSIGLNPLNHRT